MKKKAKSLKLPKQGLCEIMLAYTRDDIERFGRWIRFLIQLIPKFRWNLCSQGRNE